MKSCIRILIVLAVAVLGVDQAHAQYEIDDGVSELALGHGLNGDFIWGNYFDAIPGEETITNVAVAMGDGAIAVGDPMIVLVYEDADDDGDPTSGLTLLSSTPAVVEMPEAVGIDTFQVVEITPVTIAGGFFVAVFFDGTNNPFPAKQDDSPTAARSWFAEHDVIGQLDINNPFGTATLSGLADDFGFPGNWLIRANLSTSACVIGDVNMDGSVDLLDVTPFVVVVTNGPFQCEADINEDGEVNLLDVTPFVDILTGG